jgi:hypothetical protein
MKTVPFIICGIIGAIFISVLGLSMGWVVTSGRAHADASEIAADAVKEQLVPICVYQFRTDADQKNNLADLQKLQNWEREGFVRDHGWATMPGSGSPVAGIAMQCARRIVSDAS